MNDHDHPKADRIEAALTLTLEERLRLVEDIWHECLELSPDRPRHFAKSFDSFEDYEVWRLQQDKPRLY